MAFIPEDGTGLANANSYCDLTFANAYFADRANATWDAADDTDAKMPALIKATDYIENRFHSRWIGTEEFPNVQALSWPRKAVSRISPYYYYGFQSYPVDPNFPTDQVPLNLKKACAEYALRLLGTSSLAPDPVTDASGRAIHEKIVKVGPIETSTNYDTTGAGAVVNPFPGYPMADALLKGLLVSNSGLVRS